MTQPNTTIKRWPKCSICFKVHCYWCGSENSKQFSRDHIPARSKRDSYTQEQIAMLKLTIYITRLPKLVTQWMVPACIGCNNKRGNNDYQLAWHDLEVGLR